nr:ATP-binding protein [uncultured Holophaga sp.]
MDGLKKRVRASLQFRLSFRLVLAIVVVGLLAGAVSLVGAIKSANSLQADILRQVAVLASTHPPQVLILGTDATGGRVRDPDTRFIIQILPGTSAGQGLPLPPTMGEGLHHFRYHKKDYRVVVRPLPDGRRLAVAQDLRMRDEMVLANALNSLLPLLVLIPVLLVVALQLVRRTIAPVTRLAEEVDRRSESDLRALPEQPLVSEIQPFVTALNRLLERVGQSMAMQRRFVADSAHELRTPLTAFSLQVQRLEATEMSGEARERLGFLREGIERLRRLLDQLLGLARAQGAELSGCRWVSVQELYRRVLEDLMPLAEARGQDLGLVEGADVRVLADESALGICVKNLVDNAIRYTPEGGRIDLAVQELTGEIHLVVEDNGPGIPLTERERVLDPFYRVLGSEQPGSGLGLSIASTLVARMGGRLELGETSRFPSGLRAALILSCPAAERQEA